MKEGGHTIPMFMTEFILSISSSKHDFYTLGKEGIVAGKKEKTDEIGGNKVRKRKRPSRNWLDQKLKSKAVKETKRSWAWKRKCNWLMNALSDNISIIKRKREFIFN